MTWESAKAKSAGVNGYPAFSTQNNGFFNRHYRNLSNSLPIFNMGGNGRSFAEQEKLGRGRWSKFSPLLRRRGVKPWQFIVLVVILLYTLFWVTREYYRLSTHWRIY